MKAIVATGLLGAATIAVLTEIMSIVMALSAMRHIAAYNSWMAM